MEPAASWGRQTSTRATTCCKGCKLIFKPGTQTYLPSAQRAALAYHTSLGRGPGALFPCPSAVKLLKGLTVKTIVLTFYRSLRLLPPSPCHCFGLFKVAGDFHVAKPGGHFSVHIPLRLLAPHPRGSRALPWGTPPPVFPVTAVLALLSPHPTQLCCPAPPRTHL